MHLISHLTGCISLPLHFFDNCFLHMLQPCPQTYPIKRDQWCGLSTRKKRFLFSSTLLCPNPIPLAACSSQAVLHTVFLQTTCNLLCVWFASRGCDLQLVCLGFLSGPISFLLPAYFSCLLRAHGNCHLVMNQKGHGRSTEAMPEITILFSSCSPGGRDFHPSSTSPGRHARSTYNCVPYSISSVAETRDSALNFLSLGRPKRQRFVLPREP